MCTIILGVTKERKAKVLPWSNQNGILIAGLSGYGKSQTAAYYLAQYAYLGARLIIGDYDAPENNTETLSHRLDFARESFLLPPVSTGEGIISHMAEVKELGRQRKAGIAPLFPVVFAIDEFAAFVLSNTPAKRTTRVKQGKTTSITTAPTFLDLFLADVITLRKVDIRFMLIAQEWAKLSTTNIRPLRSQMSTKIMHRVDPAVARLFDYSRADEVRAISTLGVGQIYYNNRVFNVPLLDDKMKNAVYRKLNPNEDDI